jgi:cysteine desulfurase
MTRYPIYLDYNATTPCDPVVLEEMLPYFTTHFGNAASRSHAYGWMAEEAVDLARERVAALIGAEPSEIIFTSGATESVNLAMQGVAEAYARKGDHLVTCVTEHKAVLDVCDRLERQGRRVTRIPVDAQGRPDLDALEAAMTERTILVALMYANNETGMRMPVGEVSAIARRHGVPFFCDATQAVGKVPVDVQADGIDAMAFSGHKLYGPKGVGALYVRRKNPRVTITPMLYGGGHERGLRSGTLNVPGIVGLGKACEHAQALMGEESERLRRLRDAFIGPLLAWPEVMLNGAHDSLLPHVANLSFTMPGGDAILRRLTRDLAVSSGSACSSATLAPSHVLKAMGLGDADALASVRFSLGRYTTEEEIARARRSVEEAVQRLRQEGC